MIWLPPKTELSQFSRAVTWLREHKVPPKRVAEILDTNANHVGVLKLRGSQSQIRFPAPPDSLADLLSRPSQPFRDLFGIRQYPAIEPPVKRQGRKLAELEAEIEESFTAAATAGKFVDGALRLESLRREFGNLGSTEAIRMLARFYHHQSWLLGHSGFSALAYQGARNVIDMRQIAYEARGPKDSGKDDLRAIAESSLVASNACLISGDWQTSLKLLHLAKQAYEGQGVEPGSEYNRQLGVAYLQSEGADELATKCFGKAVEAMQEQNEAQNNAQLLMTGQRQASLIRKDWDKAQVVLAAVEQAYPPESLQRTMALHWAAACGLVLDDGRENRAAQDMLEKHREISAQFGHQLTINALLAITLDLEAKLRPAWVRKALYSSVFDRRRDLRTLQKKRQMSLD